MIWNEALILTNVEIIEREKEIDERNMSSGKKEKQNETLEQG